MKLTGQSIQEMYENIKRLFENDTLYFMVLLVLVGATSFGLGRWSAIGTYSTKDTIVSSQTASVGSTVKAAKITPKESTAQIKEKVVEDTMSLEAAISEAKYVASKSGSKYHLLWCPGAKSIKESNKVFFKSKEEAEGEGYTPAANCKGI
jgi:hypothetical protein